MIGKRILVCGKGGSGKSSIVALLANALSAMGYQIMVLDGDASNPGGLARLLFGLQKGPKPLIEFFGGREKVECPVDNPAPLTRLGDRISIAENNLDLSEIPAEYFLEKEGTLLFQVGKIERSCEGCDGPMSKVTRDFILRGDRVTLIDVEAGIEHFGRGVEKNVDAVLVVIDPTYESILIAEKVHNFSLEMGKQCVWALLNKVQSEEMHSLMREELNKKGVRIIGTLHFDPELINAGLMGRPLVQHMASEDVRLIAAELEKNVSAKIS
ncbi:MAG: adenylyl-sulfate kinase [Deltaproteobacteria bacterium]